MTCDGSGCHESLTSGNGGDRVFTQAETSTGSFTPGGSSGRPTDPKEEVPVAEETEESASGSGSSTGSGSSASASLYNFVNGNGKAACEKQIADYLGIQYACARGGGCGVSCGKPGGACVSANPSHYGACLSATDIANAPAAGSSTTPSSQLYNFVAGSGKAACEKLIADHHGAKGVCSLGGGCGVSCGKPGGGCVSANPQHYGACYSASELASLPRATTTTAAPKLYNFVAGDKATCEKSIKDHLGLVRTCKIGGGCGVSCGMPSGTCPSANPNHYGACIQQ